MKKIFPAKWQSVGEIFGDDLTLHLSLDLPLSARAWLSQIRWEGPTKDGAYFVPPHASWIPLSPAWSLTASSIHDGKEEARLILLPTAGIGEPGCFLCVLRAPRNAACIWITPFTSPWGNELLLEGIGAGARIDSCLELRDPLIFVCFRFWEICVCVISHGNGHMSITLHVEMSSAVLPSSRQHYYSISKERLHRGDQGSPPPVPAGLLSPFLSLSCWFEGACSLWHRVGRDDGHLPADKPPSPLSELPSLRCTLGSHLLREPPRVM